MHGPRAARLAPSVSVNLKKPARLCVQISSRAAHLPPSPFFEKPPRVDRAAAAWGRSLISCSVVADKKCMWIDIICCTLLNKQMTQTSHHRRLGLVKMLRTMGER